MIQILKGLKEEKNLRKSKSEQIGKRLVHVKDFKKHPFYAQEENKSKFQFFKKLTTQEMKKSVYDLTVPELNYKIMQEYKQIMQPYFDQGTIKKIKPKKYKQKKILQDLNLNSQKPIFQDTQNFLSLEQFKKKIDKQLSNNNKLLPKLPIRKDMENIKMTSYYQNVSEDIQNQIKEQIVQKRYRDKLKEYYSTIRKFQIVSLKN